MDLLSAIDRENGALLLGREFGEVGTYTPAAGSSVRMQCIFDNDFVEVDLGDYASLDGVSAIVTVETALLPNVAHGDLFSVRGGDYRVVGNEPDGTGFSRLILAV